MTETPIKTPETQSEDEKLDFKKVLPVFVIILIDLLGLTLIIPLLPLYAASFGASAFTIGLLGASYPIMQFFGAPILGRLSDRFGRRPVLIVSQIGTLIGFLVLGIANTLGLLFLSRIIDGISGGNIATAQAVIADSTNEKTRTQGLGLIGAAFGLGFIIGPIIAFITLAASDNNYALVAYVAAAFSLTSILLTYFWLEETHPVEKRQNATAKARVGLKAMFAALKRPTIGILLILMFFQQFSFGGYEHMLALFTLNRLGMNASNNAIFFVYIGVIVVAVQGYYVGRWSRKFGDRWMIILGLALLAVGMTFSAITPQQAAPWYSEAAMLAELTLEKDGEIVDVDDLEISLPDEDTKSWGGVIWLLVATIPVSIGAGILQPTINSSLTKAVTAEEVGGILGLSSAFYSMANALAPLMMGAIFEQFGSTYPFLIGGVVLFVLWGVSNVKIPKEVSG